TSSLGTKGVVQGPQDRQRLVVSDAVVNVLAIPAGIHQALTAQHTQVLRQRRLEYATGHFQLTDTGFALAELAHQHQAILVAECAHQRGDLGGSGAQGVRVHCSIRHGKYSSSRGLQTLYKNILCIQAYYLEVHMNPQVKAFLDSDSETFSYVVYDRDGGHCAVVDPVLDFDPKSGRTRTDTAQQIVDYVRAHKLTVDWVLETHAHADHISAAPFIRDQLGGKVAIGEHIRDVQKIFR